jgi:hypothetical protein
MPMFAVPFTRSGEWNEFRCRADERLSVVEPKLGAGRHRLCYPSPSLSRSNHPPSLFAFPLRCATIGAMSFNAKHPPIWLRKLHVSAAQARPSDYPARPEDGILLCCSLSDEVRAWSLACTGALGLSQMSAPAPPLNHPFHPERRGVRNAVR